MKKVKTEKKVDEEKRANKENAPKRSTQITEEQRKVMLEFIKTHSKLKTGRFASDFTHADAQKLWEELAQLLNVLTGSTKTWKQWRKCYQDWKGKVKNAVAAERKSRGGTGGGPPLEIIEDPGDQSMIEILDPVMIDGLPDIKESEVLFDFPGGYEIDAEKTVFDDSLDEKLDKKQINTAIKTGPDEFLDENVDNEQKTDGVKVDSTDEESLKGIFSHTVEDDKIGEHDSYSNDEKAMKFVNLRSSNITVIEESNVESNENNNNDVNCDDKPKLELKEEVFNRKKNQKSGLGKRGSIASKKLQDAIDRTSGMTSIMENEVSIKGQYYKRKLEIMEESARLEARKVRAFEKMAEVMERI